MKIKIIDAVSFHAFQPGSFGFGIVTMMDTRFPKEQIDGEPMFDHRLSANKRIETLTDAEREEIKTDCEALVNLLKKFYHESEFVVE